MSRLSTIGVPEAGSPGHASAPTLPNRAVHVQAALRRGGCVAQGARESLRVREPGQLNGPGDWRWSQCLRDCERMAPSVKTAARKATGLGTREGRGCRTLRRNATDGRNGSLLSWWVPFLDTVRLTVVQHYLLHVDSEPVCRPTEATEIRGAKGHKRTKCERL